MEEWIRTVLKHAASLRAAGVTSIGPQSATFAPADPPPPDDTKVKSDVADPPMNPFEDPAAYPDGIVPHFDIEPLTQE